MGTDCIVAPQLSSDGYGCRQTKAAKEKFGTTRLHRQIMMMVHGREAVEGHDVLHECDNPPCFRYEHPRHARRQHARHV